MMKHTVRFSAIIIFLLSIVSCSGDNDSENPNSNLKPIPVPDPISNPNPNPTPTTTFNADLKGVNEVPENCATAVGSAMLIFDNPSNVFSITVTHNVVGANGAHIHKAAEGKNGDIVFTLTRTSETTYNYTSPALTTAQQADLIDQLYYVNIHSAAYTGGEIRGQLWGAFWDY